MTLTPFFCLVVQHPCTGNLQGISWFSRLSATREGSVPAQALWVGEGVVAAGKAWGQAIPVHLKLPGL